MNWKAELSLIEETFGIYGERDWLAIANHLSTILSDNESNWEVNVRVIYAMHHILLEEKVQVGQFDQIQGLLIKNYETSLVLMQTNAEYLFFIGKLLYVGEWLFRLNDDLKPLKEKKAFIMQKKAQEMEPDNLLFNWAVSFSEGDLNKVRHLAMVILNEKQSAVEWLLSVGFPGDYMLESIKYSYDQNI